jgi:hypothetical protein
MLPCAGVRNKECVIKYYFHRYCQGGELFQYIIDQKHITEAKAALIMK